MQKIKNKKNNFLACTMHSIIFLVIFCGCKIQLAPSYDQSITDNLGELSKTSMQLFASVEEKQDTLQYTKFEEKYNMIIGSIGALKIQVGSRPMPDNKTLKKLLNKANQKLKIRNIPVISIDSVPTLYALTNIESNIGRMKSNHKNKGLKKEPILLFKNAVVQALDQATTYESFLNR